MILINASLQGYFIEITKQDQFSRALSNRLERTKNGLEFKKLVALPSVVYKGVPVQVDSAVAITPLKTIELKPENQMMWLYEHGYFFSFVTNEFRLIATMLNQTIKADNLGTTCLGLPQLFSLNGSKMVTGANGKLNNSNLFAGVFTYDNT